MVKWLNTAGDTLTALACFALVASLLYLARKYHLKRLSGVFLAFGVMFFAFGLRATVSAVLWWHEGPWVEAAAMILRLSAAVAVAGCAAVTARCAASAFVAFSRLSVLERAVTDRVSALETEARYRTEQDDKAREVLSQLRELAREFNPLPPDDRL